MKYLFLIVVIITIGFSTWASSSMFGLPLNGMNQGDVSNLYPNLVTPATYAFSIWGLIYLSWAVLAVLIVTGYIQVKNMFLWVFSGGVLVSSLWLIPFQYQYELISLGVMIIILVHALWSLHLAQTEHMYTRLTSELFLGWITVATAANIAVVVVSTPALRDIGIFSPVVWTLIGFAVATLIHIGVALRYNAYVTGFVLIWALIANIVAHNDPLQRNGIAVLIVIMLAVQAYNFFIRRKNGSSIGVLNTNGYNDNRTVGL